MKCWSNVVKKTFSDQVFITFNNLPKAIRIIDNKKENQKILQRIKKYYIDRTLARTLPL